MGQSCRETIQRTVDRTCFSDLRSLSESGEAVKHVSERPYGGSETSRAKVEDLTSSSGPALLTKMLQCGNHLPAGVVVTSVRDMQKKVTDGVKGDKAVLEVTYSGSAQLPSCFFLKCNLQRLGAMRLLVATSDVCLSEALFYHYLAPKLNDSLRTPKCIEAAVG